MFFLHFLPFVLLFFGQEILSTYLSKWWCVLINYSFPTLTTLNIRPYHFLEASVVFIFPSFPFSAILSFQSMKVLSLCLKHTSLAFSISSYGIQGSSLHETLNLWWTLDVCFCVSLSHFTFIVQIFPLISLLFYSEIEKFLLICKILNRWELKNRVCLHMLLTKSLNSFWGKYILLHNISKAPILKVLFVLVLLLSFKAWVLHFLFTHLLSLALLVTTTITQLYGINLLKWLVRSALEQ